MCEGCNTLNYLQALDAIMSQDGTVARIRQLHKPSPMLATLKIHVVLDGLAERLARLTMDAHLRGESPETCRDRIVAFLTVAEQAKAEAEQFAIQKALETMDLEMRG